MSKGSAGFLVLWERLHGNRMGLTGSGLKVSAVSPSQRSGRRMPLAQNGGRVARLKFPTGFPPFALVHFFGPMNRKSASARRDIAPSKHSPYANTFPAASVASHLSSFKPERNRWRSALNKIKCPQSAGTSKNPICFFREIIKQFMRMKTPSSAHKVFRALAHPARVQVVRELSGGKEKCVCELVEVCGLGWSTVSRHLSVLREAGVIADEKRGLQVFYRLTLECVARFINCLDHPGSHPELQKRTACRC